MQYKIGKELKINEEIKIITDILPVIIGDQTIDNVYELDGDMEQRYNTKELEEILQNK
jgi:hypothetical protein